VVSPYVIGLIQTATGSTGNGVLGLAVSLIIGSVLVFTVPAKLVNSRKREATKEAMKDTERVMETGVQTRA
jgi:MFS-type transporter involved in bile tolerance (Atg22 family)